jgi:tRNA pseudouridine55 synthase
MNGALLVDKPPGPTSHDIVAFVRRTLKISRVGHTGTLDPLATGLLVVLVGHATRLAQFLVADEKEYVADVRLGIATPTYDAASLADGVRAPTSDVRRPTDPELEAVLDHFRGSFLQTPPPYSAKKVAGVAAYERARKNEPVELRPTSVTVRELRLLPESDLGPRSSDLATGDTSLVRLRVAASSGFYVRSLAHDIGQRLGCGAHLEALRRTRVGGFRVEEACTLDVLEAAGPAAPCVRTMNGLLGAWPEVRLTEEGLRRAGHGNSLGPQHLAGRPPERPGRVRVLDGAGELLAVAEERPDGLLHPLLVLR